jgi:hypothetical protein
VGATPWLIYSALSGAAYASRSAKPAAVGQISKVVCCEKCGRRYAYELKRRGRDAKHLAQLLETGVEAVPCPACGWYQSDMIPAARRQHRRWMVYAGQCLTLGLVPVVAVIGEFFYVVPERQGPPSVPWPAFVASLVCLLAVGIGLFIWRHRLGQKFNPNDGDAEAHKRYGQSRATLLPGQEAQDVAGPPVVHRRLRLIEDHAALFGCFVGIICVAGLVGCGGFYGVRSLIRANVAARFEKDLAAYVALSPALPPQPGGVTGKVKGKLVVVNVNERKLHDLHFALPDELCASKPEEVGTVVLLTWKQSPTSKEPLPVYGPSLYANRYIVIGQVNVFDWERKSEIASGTFLGDVADFDPDGKPKTGPKPDDQVLKFLTGLPRE